MGLTLFLLPLPSDVSSPLNFPSSSAGNATPRARAPRNGPGSGLPMSSARSGGSEPLFFPGCASFLSFPPSLPRSPH